MPRLILYPIRATRAMTQAFRRRLAMAFVALATSPIAALADGLPTVDSPENGGGGGLMSNLQGYAADAAILVGLLLATSAFLVVGGGAVGQFNQARQRNEWGGFATTLVIGVILVVIVIWLADQASQILA